jgi:hypothetical protein
LRQQPKTRSKTLILSSPIESGSLRTGHVSRARAASTTASTEQNRITTIIRVVSRLLLESCEKKRDRSMIQQSVQKRTPALPLLKRAACPLQP